MLPFDMTRRHCVVASVLIDIIGFRVAVIRQRGVPMNDDAARVLLERVLTGDKQALTELYDMFERLVYSFAYRTTGNADSAEEIVQDVFMKIWRTTTRYDSQQGKITTWILSITRNAAIDYHRRTKRHQSGLSGDEDEIVNLSDPASGPEALAEIAQDRQMIREAMASLPIEQREIIELMYFHGDTQQAIALHLGVPPGTVKSRARLAISKLRSHLESRMGVNNRV